MKLRNIHLDFHTSEWIQSVAEDFEADEFAQTFHQAKVESVTLFSRCHHGWAYYPSLLIPKHPFLKKVDLLGEQIAALKRYGIESRVYTTVQWDARIAREHPNWLCRDEKGNPIKMQNVEEPHFYHGICINSPYRNYFFAHLKEVTQQYGNDIQGVFLDILFPVPCCCEYCVQEMRLNNKDPDDREERLTFSRSSILRFIRQVYEILRMGDPHLEIFFNSSHIDPSMKDYMPYYTHLELESLPSGGWGYDHFPITVKYVENLGKPMLGMTGKFHTYWGDFHSFKCKEALEFECFNMLFNGCGISVGDQLHPRGKLSEATYRLVGEVFEEISSVERWLQSTKRWTSFALLSPEKDGGATAAMIGFERLMTELKLEHTIIDDTMDFSPYTLLILPDDIFYSDQTEKKILHYLHHGGKVLGFCGAGAYSTVFGIQELQESPYDRSFILPNSRIGKRLPKEEHVMYLRGKSIVPTEDAEVLMDEVAPYFNRGGDRFCSHQHTPSSGQVCGAAVLRRENTVYFAHPILEIYRKNHAPWIREIFYDALEELISDIPLTSNLPSHVSVRLRACQEKVYVLLLNYHLEKPSEDIFIVQQAVPIKNAEISLFVGTHKVREVSSKTGEDISWTCSDRRLSLRFDVPRGFSVLEILLEQRISEDVNEVDKW